MKPFVLSTAVARSDQISARIDVPVEAPSSVSPGLAEVNSRKEARGKNRLPPSSAVCSTPKLEYTQSKLFGALQNTVRLCGSLNSLKTQA
jgi:hypothetical protein